jgi:hypothetical protein
MKKRFERVCAASIIRTAIVTWLLTGGFASGASAATVLVVNDNDQGVGSFRRAIALANGNSAITEIRFLPGVNTVLLQSTVFFTGSQDLTIAGSGATLDGTNAGGPALVIDEGSGDLTVVGLTIQNAPGEGILYQVNGGATGTIRISFLNVTIRNNGSHGVLVNDQVDPSVPELPNGDPVPPGPNPNGSAAALDVTVLGSRFVDNGNHPVFSVSDNDGLRVNEGGDGDLRITVRLSVFERNGADGIEVDERGEGGVLVDMLLTRLTENGPFDEEDLDDGFDIDEWNDGSIIGSVVSSSAIDNWEEGFDFNENDAGNMQIAMVLVAANGNREEGIDLEEDDDFAGGGDLVTTLTGIVANGNGVDGGDGGVKIREKGTGNLDATLSILEASNNVDSNSGIHIREDAVGNLGASVTGALANRNARDGIVFDERGDGDLEATVTNAVATNNADDGVQADQVAPGTASLVLTNVDVDPNGDDPTAGNVTPTVVP